MGDVDNLLRRCVGNGPTLALVDPRHPSCRDLPNVPAALVLHVADTEGRDAILGGDAEGFDWPYGGPRGEPLKGWIHWEAVLAVSGPYGPRQRATGVLDEEEMPQWTGGPGAVRRTLERIAGSRPQGRPEWHLGGPPEAAGLDKREALESLTEGTDGVIALLVRHGVESPTSPASVFVLPADAIHVSGLGVQGPKGRLTWPAIGAVQDLRTGRGWFWVDDLPAELAAQVPEAGPRAGGQPLAPLPTTPVVPLPAPPQTDKRRALLACDKQGGAILLINPAAEGADVPGDFGDLPLLAVPLFRIGENLPPAVEVTGLYVKTTLPDFQGTARRLTLPWNAIWAIAAQQGARTHNWPVDQPEVVQEALRLAEKVAAGAPIETEPQRAPFWGVGEAGVVYVGQPLGPEVDGDRPTLFLDFRLEHEGPAG